MFAVIFYLWCKNVKLILYWCFYRYFFLNLTLYMKICIGLIGKWFIYLKNRYIVLRDIAETKSDRKRPTILLCLERSRCKCVSELSLTLVELFDKANSQCKKFQIIGNVPQTRFTLFFHPFFSWFEL